MSTLMRFELEGNQLQFLGGGDYPASRPVEIVGVADRTAAGVLQYEKLGVVISRRVIEFNLMAKADYFGLIDWFLNIAEGSKNSFTFVDEYGDEGIVKITDTILNFTETSMERYSGTLNLEYTDYA